MNYQELLHSPLIPRQTAPLIRKGAQSGVPVLILGEEGTKRELIARVIHDAGEWKPHPFLKLDCRSSLESDFAWELSAVLKEIDYGRIPATLYLKEVSCLDRTNQIKLLKLLEEGTFQGEGLIKDVKNLRFISSSDHLGRKVREGKFSSDLYERLSTLLIPLPPLRDRTDEIPSIAQYILSESIERMKLGAIRFSDEVLRLFRNYRWPGNLKEMERMIVRSAHSCEGGTIIEKDLLFEVPREDDSFFYYPKGPELPHPSLSGAHWVSFFLELAHRIKNPLVSIRTFTQLLHQRFDDEDFREGFYRIVSLDIERIDAVIEGLLNYIRISLPERKSNTIHSILKEVLGSYEAQLADRKIQVVKKLDQMIPETTFHDEQLRYIFHSLFEYMLPSISVGGSVGFLARSFQERGERSIEILIAFDGYRKAQEQIGQVLGIPVQKEETVELELRFVQEIVKRNQGSMKLKVNEEKSRTTILLRLPAERRKVLYYPSVSR